MKRCYGKLKTLKIEIVDGEFCMTATLKNAACINCSVIKACVHKSSTELGVHVNQSVTEKKS